LLSGISRLYKEANRVFNANKPFNLKAGTFASLHTPLLVNSTLDTKGNLLMRIRQATISDTDALASLASRTFFDTYDDLSDEEFERYLSEFFSSDGIHEYLEEPGQLR
jgi:hypothetical protein